MGLAGARKRTKISHDPNNTSWSRSTTSYGHRIMTSQGWTPGSFLGASNAAHADHFTPASASHIRVTVKDDTLGLGAKARGKDENEPTGLDAFQDLLGRLNGKSDVEIETEQRKREEVSLVGYVERKYKTMTFVKGGMLAQDKMPESSAPKAAEGQEGSSSSQETEPTKSEKRRKKRKLKDTDSKDVAVSDEDRTLDTSTRKKKEKKEKRERKKKKKDRRADMSESDRDADAPPKKSKKKKSRKDKSDSSSSEADDTKQSSVKSPAAQKPAPAMAKPRVPMGRHVVRSRHIQQKKAALMDSKSLSEIFMVKS